MGTLAEMKARIASEIMNGSIPADIVNAITDAWRHYRSTAFYFNSRLATFNTAAGQEWYGAGDHADIPNITAIKSLKVGADGTRQDLTVYDADNLESIQDGTIIGEPFGFAYDEQKIRFIGIPDAVYPVRARWVYRLDLPPDNEANAWTDDAEILIRNRAKMFLALGVLEDEGMAARLAPMEEAAKQKLLKESRTRRSNGILRTEVAGLTGGRSFNINRGF